MPRAPFGAIGSNRLRTAPQMGQFSGGSAPWWTYPQTVQRHCVGAAAGAGAGAGSTYGSNSDAAAPQTGQTSGGLGPRWM